MHFGNIIKPKIVVRSATAYEELALIPNALPSMNGRCQWIFMNAVKSIKINALQLAAVAVWRLFRRRLHFKYELKSLENASHPNYK